MAAFRGISRSVLKYVSPQNPNYPTKPQLCFYRDFSSSKLFIKGISFSTTENTLSKVFSQYGEVVEAKIIMNNDTNRSKGFGYVTFASVNDAQKALEELNGKIVDGRVVFVDNVRPRHRLYAGVPKASGPPKPADDDS